MAYAQMHADPGMMADGQPRHPLDTAAQCQAAWDHVTDPANAGEYSPSQLARVKARIKAAATKHGYTLDTDPEVPGQPDEPDPMMRSTDPRGDAYCTRSYDFELRSVPGGDGRTLEGYVAVFNKRTRIPDRAGDFEEEIFPGFADRSLREHGYPVMQFDHGKDPRVGSVPIGKYEVFEPDRKGYFVRGGLFDNPVVEPVRQAIEAKAIKGMSFRFHVAKKGGDRWERRAGAMDLRAVLDADVPEAGPVVFPAYADTSVTVRSLLATFTEEERQAALADLLEQAGMATDLTDLTGQSRAWSPDGGEYDVEPWEGDTSPAQPSTDIEARDRAMRLLRPPIVLP